jgi:hypothetical protein
MVIAFESPLGYCKSDWIYQKKKKHVNTNKQKNKTTFNKHFKPKFCNTHVMESKNKQLGIRPCSRAAALGN